MIDEKKSQVLSAALKMFSAYGFKRVTMNDIAEEAGMSRPSLYLMFSNKEDIFRGSIVNYAEKSLEQIRTGLPEKQGLEAKLSFALEVWIVQGYEMINKSPHAGEFIDCTYGFARDVIELMYADFEKLVLEILEPEADRIEAHGMVSADFAHFIRVSAQGCKAAAQNVEDLRKLIAMLLKVVLATVK
ncbi:helix-turn-helix domain-containing protein [Rubellicoccus peritrichatus]|uniref:Helix-turn-helix domain-containing protein n=1 Tax=Rubellicoccus peritrichatus TaxID=3080537 RepID=A0AAQ3L8T5_9BACT|nr:helix-turn-helix domain-containing protein [Puniceicoccus sp. CR14]WOO39802.1 helix-turn-helix domain-containing protein [Puniceicoccus sp. CR14]